MASRTRWKGWIQLLLGLGITFLFFYMMAPFVVATLIGGIIAIICYPLFEKLSKKMPPTLSAVSVTGALTLGILLPIFFILFAVVYKLLELTSHFQGVLKEGWGQESFFDWPWVHSVLKFAGEYFPVDKVWLETQSLELLRNAAGKMVAAMTNSLAAMPDFFVGFFIVILSFYFLLVDGKRFLGFLSDISPLQGSRSRELYSTFENTCRAVVVGMFSAAGVQGVLIAIFFWMTGLPTPLLYGLVGVGMGMIPVVGNAPLWIGGTIVLFVHGSIFKAVLMIIGGILIGLSDNVVRTVVMKGTSDMHPFLALVSVFGALNLIGAPGIFLGPIIAAVFVAFLKILAQEIRGATKAPRRRPARA